MMNNRKLFCDVERMKLGPQYSMSLFKFLNSDSKVDSKACREMLEDWFSNYPVAGLISDSYFSRLTTVKIPVFHKVKNELQSEFSIRGGSNGNRSSSKEINDADQPKSDTVASVIQSENG